MQISEIALKWEVAYRNGQVNLDVAIQSAINEATVELQREIDELNQENRKMHMIIQGDA